MNNVIDLPKRIPQHSSATNEHPTPMEVIVAAHRLMGGIDLDPATTVTFNARVGATKIYTIDDDGLSHNWHGRIFLNPPGGKRGRESSMLVWWKKLIDEWGAERTRQAFFVGFTLEILRLSQASVMPVQQFPRCYPKERLAFRGDDPTHANVLVWLPPYDVSSRQSGALLKEAFGHIGFCEGGAR